MKVRCSARVGLVESPEVMMLEGEPEVTFVPAPRPAVARVCLYVRSPEASAMVQLEWADLLAVLQAAIAAGVTLAELLGLFARSRRLADVPTSASQNHDAPGGG